LLSVVVPTFNEAGNLPGLADALKNQLVDVEYELLIADDRSEDGTADVVLSLQAHHPIRLIQAGDRPRDLSLSVLDGLQHSKYDVVLVMDADLSHPAGTIPEMLATLRANPQSFVLGSRYVSGGSFDREWSIWRFFNSHIATLIAKPLVKCNDPMSGFFLFNKSMVNADLLNPLGYKIGLELMVRGQFTSVEEVPIAFQDRQIGESKMNLNQQFKYLRHLRRLYLHKFGSFAEFINFGAVGASGFVVDVCFYFFLQWLGFSHVTARGMSFWPAATWNWALNRISTFGERKKRPKARQWLEFLTSSLLGFALSWGTYTYLTTNIDFFNEYKLVALILGIAGASLFNFAASSLFVYSDKRSTRE
jgi:dolichol-phosphate mannosyltransferase